MGTLGLLGHIIDGRRRGTFNQYDSYPSGLGVAIVMFIKRLSDAQIDQMKQRVEQLQWVNSGDRVPDEAKSYYARANYGLPGNGPRSLHTWGDLMNLTQDADSLQPILDGRLVHQVDSTRFEEDSIWCEWVYYIDWSRKKLQISNNRGLNEEYGFDDISERTMCRLNYQ